ncbi:MAG: lysophospholipid acyltransferase family protein [Candidatus Cloacimonetes bacterium]|nr:lysophospholipid acyltransferase family protein [Candidatus Cloacimonadota bacterium]
MKHKIILFLEKWIAFFVLNLLGFTFSYKVHGLKKPYPHCIYIFWHRNILPLLLNRKNEGVVVLISRSKDGDYIAEPCKAFGFQTARGSSSRKGTAALKEMISLSKNHSIAITPDGPKGPAGQIKEGALQLAYLTQLPICAVKVSVSTSWAVNSWDRFIIPKPFAKIDIFYSEPMMISSKADIEVHQKSLQEYMNS